MACPWLPGAALTLSLSLRAALSAAAPPAYPVAALAPALLKDATSVVRAYDVEVVFDQPDHYTYRVRRVVTVLQPAASAEGELVVSSSSLNRITDLSARVFDGDGKQLRKLSGPTAWHDVSATDAGTFLDDSRARVADARQGTYPYTVELTYEISSANPLFLPEWQPQQAWRQSVERATFRLRHPAALPVRWHARHLPAGAARPDSVAGTWLEHRWQVQHLPARQAVPLSPPPAELVPAVWCAPTTFKVQGYAGSQATWADLGHWYGQLNAGRDALPAALVAEMTVLRDSVADPRRRARRVYERVQATTRYVSIQLGLGGWQTIAAADVARTGYGDCKALTTYTRALLAAAGVPGYVALVRAGADAPDILPEWVAPQFNHVIVCVPLAAAGGGRPDTLWLECTSQTQTFGALGDFTANRHALLITPAGGQLVRTPTLDATNTARRRLVHLRLAPSGAATATLRTDRTGPLGDTYARLLPQAPADQRRAITDQFPGTTPFTLSTIRLTARPATPAGAIVREELTLTLPAAAARAGQRLRLPLNLFNIRPSTYPDSVRTAPLWLTAAATFSDTLVVELPAGARVENVPPPVDLRTPFGTYRAAAVPAPDHATLTYTRELRTVAGRFPASEYPAYVAFSEQVARADRQLATLLLAPTQLSGK